MYFCIAHVVTHAHVIAGFQPHARRHCLSWRKAMTLLGMNGFLKETRDWCGAGIVHPPKLYFSFGGVSAPFIYIR